MGDARAADSFESDERLLRGSDEKQSREDRQFALQETFLGKHRPRRQAIPWILACCSFLLNFALIFLALKLGLQPRMSKFGSLDAGYSTDMGKDCDLVVGYFTN